MIKLQELAGMAKEISSKKWFLNADEEVTAIDNDALPDDTEEAFIGCAANIQLAKYMAAANPETILAIAEAYSALEQRLKAAETEVQRLNATAQPDDSNDGYVKAFYEIAAILGISAQPNSPKHVFETVMKPKLQALVAAAQPVSGPEWTNEQCLEFLTIAFRHANISGDIEMDDIRLGIRMVNSTATGGDHNA